MIVKDENIEQPIPILWRDFIKFIVDEIKNKKLSFYSNEIYSYSIKLENINYIYNNIIEYGDSIDHLPDDSWKTSICRWMGSHWNVLVDLFTVREGASDLVMFLSVYEDGPSYKFEIRSVHVP